MGGCGGSQPFLKQGVQSGEGEQHAQTVDCDGWFAALGSCPFFCRQFCQGHGFGRGSSGQCRARNRSPGRRTRHGTGSRFARIWRRCRIETMRSAHDILLLPTSRAACARIGDVAEGGHAGRKLACDTKILVRAVSARSPGFRSVSISRCCIKCRPASSHLARDPRGQRGGAFEGG